MNSPVPLELAAKIAMWRQKAATNELTLKEMKEGIIFLRAGRLEAAKSSASAKRSKAIKEIPHADDLLNELEGL
jgi:hypothetical protein